MGRKVENFITSHFEVIQGRIDHMTAANYITEICNIKRVISSLKLYVSIQIFSVIS
jgi:hypothetical protein